MSVTATDRGKAAEQHARQHLQAHGLELLRCNYHSRYGEIDLVMRDRDSIVFVEVRYRRQLGFGSAAESVDRRKQARLIACAQHYLQTHPECARQPCRFDVVTLGAGARLQWIRNAFSA
ncbi:MAG: YraN family protein [Pseudomonadota bacterium]